MVDKKKILFFMWSFSLGGGAEKNLINDCFKLGSEKVWYRYPWNRTFWQRIRTSTWKCEDFKSLSRLSPTKMVKSIFVEIENLFPKTNKTIASKRSIWCRGFLYHYESSPFYFLNVRKWKRLLGFMEVLKNS